MSDCPETFAALWPGGESAVAAIAPAPRPGSLDGKRIAFLWDYVFRGEEIFPALQRGLDEAFKNPSFVSYEAFGSTFGGHEHQVLEALPARLREFEVDLVVSGIGC